MNMRDPVDILARTLWGEARGEGRHGMEAVAAVILNRAAHPRWWGSNIIQVCTAPMQFSCWSWGDPNRPKLVSVTGADPAFVTALAVAEQAVAGKLVDPTNGADSYYAAGTPEPAWAEGREPCAVIGRHKFYRLETPAPAQPATETADDLNAAELKSLA